MKRIFWKEFISKHPLIFEAVKTFLYVNGFNLVLKFDDKDVCHDVYIEERDVAAS